MTAYRVRYAGPQNSAMEVATALADAQGVDLTSSAAPERTADGVVLELIVEGDADAVLDAVGAARRTLPGDARIDVDAESSS